MLLLMSFLRLSIDGVHATYLLISLRDMGEKR